MIPLLFDVVAQTPLVRLNPFSTAMTLGTPALALESMESKEGGGGPRDMSLTSFAGTYIVLA